MSLESDSSGTTTEGTDGMFRDRRGDATYTPDFFRSIGGSAQQSSSVVLPILFDALDVVPASILDLGCGTGAWLRSAVELGANDVLGIDGDYIPAQQLLLDEKQFLSADLTRPLVLNRRFDLAMSLEVGEHLPPDAAGTFVASLCRHSDLILFSAAVPGQGGEHHVNERLASYWAELFRRHGYEPFDLVRPNVWADERVMYYYRQNILIYGNERGAARLRDQRPQMPLDLIHPRQLEYWHEVGVSEAWPMFVSALRRTVSRRRKRIHPR